MGGVGNDSGGGEGGGLVSRDIAGTFMHEKKLASCFSMEVFSNELVLWVAL